MLEISAEKICYIIIKAREFEVKDVVTDPNPASNAADEGMYAVLESHRDDPVEEELVTLISSLSVDEQVDLVALSWLGRQDGDLSDWQDLRTQAMDARNDRTAQYLMGSPLLAEQLEEGLSIMGLSCEEYGINRL